MDPLAPLDSASLEFRSRLATITPDQWQQPTDLGNWTVRELIDHVTGANRMSVVLLGGGSREEAIASMASAAADTDLLASFDESTAAQRAAFATPGAFEMVVPHPAGDIPGGRLFGFRLVDLTIHAWDLARATGGDLDLNPMIVTSLWETLSPTAPHLVATGVFGEGASGAVADDAPVQQRLLDMLGRRP
ncbi:MAG: TIGR03086 family metal-binding protein [Actinomycetota bacterium]|nr:TIGR03086 family metal-binding protein [Actinomycetota bacterium]